MMIGALIGPTFAAEIKSAGLQGLPFAWGADGVTLSPDLSEEDRDRVQAVVDAHDPGAVDRRPSLDAVNAERDRRMRAGFAFAGTMFDYDEASQRRITGAAALAGFALTLGGKAPGDLRWHGGETDFVWIAQDNSYVPMDAVTCFGFGRAAAAWEQAHVFAARALKDAIDAAEDPSAVDITAGWPA